MLRLLPATASCTILVTVLLVRLPRKKTAKLRRLILLSRVTYWAPGETLRAHLRRSLINAMDPRVPTHLRNLKKKTVCERRLRATHLDQSNYLPNLKQGEINKYNYTIENCSSHCSRVLPGSESCAFLQEQMRMRSGYLSIWLLHLIQDFQWMSVRVTYWTSLEMLRVCNIHAPKARGIMRHKICV